MNTLLETSYKKATQALNFFAREKDGKINKMKAIKLLYLADRLHIRKYGRPIIWDEYWAMKLGPVGSRAKKVAELNVPAHFLSYAQKYIKPTDGKKRAFISLKPVDTDIFSKTDVECLEKVNSVFGDRDQFELAELTHQYPEWKKYAKELGTGKKRVAMNNEDFFAEANEANKDNMIFAQKKSDLDLARDSFRESEETAAIFA